MQNKTKWKVCYQKQMRDVEPRSHAIHKSNNKTNLSSKMRQKMLLFNQYPCYLIFSLNFFFFLSISLSFPFLSACSFLTHSHSLSLSSSPTLSPKKVYLKEFFHWKKKKIELHEQQDRCTRAALEVFRRHWR